MTTPAAGPGPPRARGVLEQLLSPFVPVQAGEGATALLLMLNVFALLCSYYIIRIVREPLIQAGGGAEAASYSAAAQAVLLLFLVPAYGAFASRVDRVRLITGVTLFFAANLVLFYVLARAAVPFLGVAFYVWVGIFNLMIVAQFWAFANDVYSPEQGKRLFAIVMFGANMGAVFGAWCARVLARPLGVYPLMLVATAILLLTIPIMRIVNARQLRERAASDRAASRAEERPLAPVGGFRMILEDRYLLLIALMMLVYNFVNTNGEFLMRRGIGLETARLVAIGQTEGLSADAFRKLHVAEFYGDFNFWVSLATAVIQLGLVSRLLKLIGVRGALLLLPLVAFGGYGATVLLPVLACVRLAKIVENSTDLSIQNTTRQTLFLPTSREAKYKAKAAIDSLFVRAGDLCSAGFVFVGTRFAFGTSHFAAANLALVAAWFALAVSIGRRHARLTEAAHGVQPS